MNTLHTLISFSFILSPISRDLTTEFTMHPHPTSVLCVINHQSLKFLNSSFLFLLFGMWVGGEGKIFTISKKS